VYALVASFRFLHFLTTEKLDDMFSLIRGRLEKHGLFAFSGFCPYELPLKRGYNLLYINSVSVTGDQYARNISDTEAGTRIRKEQNLGRLIHFFDLDLVKKLADRHNFEIMLAGFPSTKIVEGYVLRAV